MISIAVGAVVTESGENVGQAASSGGNLIKLERMWRVKWHNRGGRGYKEKAGERVGRIGQPNWRPLWD